MANRPKPTRLKLLQGNPGKRRLDRSEPEPETASGLKPPDWLDEEARKKWREVCPELESLGVLANIDSDLLACYCLSWIAIKQADREIDEHGITLKDEGGRPVKKNPAVTVKDEAQRQLRAFGAELGIGPASRTRLSVTPPLTQQRRRDKQELARRILD